MQISTNNPLYSQVPKPWYSLIIFIVFFFAGMFIGQFLGLVISIFTYDLPIREIPEILSLPFTEEKRATILLLQGLGAVGGFIIAGIIYLSIVERMPLSRMFNLENFNLWALVLAIVIVVSFMFVNTLFIEWNLNVDFPGFIL